MWFGIGSCGEGGVGLRVVGVGIRGRIWAGGLEGARNVIKQI